MNSGPWGPWSGGNQGPKPQSTKEEKKSLPKKEDVNFDEFFKKAGDFFKKNFNGNSNKDYGKAPKSLIGLIVLSLVLLWLALGIYKVDSDENAAVLYFGK